MTYRESKNVGNVIAAVLGGVLVVFTAGFLYLLFTGLSLVDTSVGLTMSFVGIEYIAIEATFLFLILSGGYYVVSNAIRRPVIEIEVEDE